MWTKIKRYVIQILKMPIEIKKIQHEQDVNFNKLRVGNYRNVMKGFSEARSQGCGDLVCSLTTYGNRVHDVHYVIKSLLCQTVLPSKIVLWLSDSEYTAQNIPISLKNLQREIDIFDIEFCEDIKSYKKLIPSLKKFPDSLVVTVDDDIIYPDDLLENLIEEHVSAPKDIICTRAHKIVVKNGTLQPYNKWEYETGCKFSSHLIFPTSGAGTLFPPGSLHEDIFDSSLFSSLCPTADDVWFKFMALKNGTNCRPIRDTRDWSSRFIEIKSHQEHALSITNVGLSKNDLYIKQILNHYNNDFMLEILVDASKN
ncbi:glycosyl transferase [Vibrio cyclitrophicus]